MSAKKSLAVTIGTLAAAIILAATSPVPPPKDSDGGFEWGLSSTGATAVVGLPSRVS